MNDLVRSKAMDPETGKISLFWEIMAGGAAGASQVVSGSLGCDYSWYSQLTLPSRTGRNESVGSVAKGVHGEQ